MELAPPGSSQVSGPDFQHTTLKLYSSFLMTGEPNEGRSHFLTFLCSAPLSTTGYMGGAKKKKRLEWKLRSNVENTENH